MAEEIRRVVPFVETVSTAQDSGKNTWHSPELTRRLGELTVTGWPVLLSASRKDWVGAWLGARIFRAHDVLATGQALHMLAAIRGDRPPAGAVRGLA